MARKKAVRKTTTKAPRRTLTGEQIARLNEIVKEQAGVIAQQRELLKAAQHAAQVEFEAQITTSGSHAGPEVMVSRDGVKTMSPVKQPQAPIAAAVEDLQLVANDLTASFSGLVGRMDPILAAPAPPSDAKLAVEPTCSMESALRSIMLSIRSTVEWIDATKLRLML